MSADDDVVDGLRRLGRTAGPPPDPGFADDLDTHLRILHAEQATTPGSRSVWRLAVVGLACATVAALISLSVIDREVGTGPAGDENGEEDRRSTPSPTSSPALPGQRPSTLVVESLSLPEVGGSAASTSSTAAEEADDGDGSTTTASTDSTDRSVTESTGAQGTDRPTTSTSSTATTTVTTAPTRPTVTTPTSRTTRSSTTDTTTRPEASVDLSVTAHRSGRVGLEWALRGMRDPAGWRIEVVSGDRGATVVVLRDGSSRSVTVDRVAGRQVGFRVVAVNDAGADVLTSEVVPQAP